MADTLKMELLARDFNRMLEELAGIDSSIEFKDVVLGVAERVLSGAARGTKAADSGRIKNTFAKKEYTTFGGKTYRITNRFPDRLWAEIERMRAEGLDVKLNARGLSKQSFQHVAASFGRSIAGNSPGYVAAANYKGRQYPEDGSSTEAGSGAGFTLTVVNSSPIAQAAGGRFALQRAMRGEVKYFEHNLANRAFATVASRAKKYPGIFARPPTV